jgi:phospholipase/carboxylesterase
MLDCIEINPPGDADACVIWLHGLGANGHDFEPIVPELKLAPDKNVRFIFPHAPSQAVTINNGYVMPAWFDITSLERLDGVDADGIERSVADVQALIEQQQQRGIDSQRIIIAGFSQGGVIALHVAACSPKPLGGVIALSTYLPLHEQLSSRIDEAHKNTPVFMAHGCYDPVVPITLGRMSFDLVKTLFNNHQWHEYAMEHSVCMEEIEMISEWLQQLPALQPQ